ncbi:MAG: hypothetical protein GY911_08535 [Actinomycetales bacterium]|nr:hypothetical protein [Actinomycetales bacterium]
MTISVHVSPGRRYRVESSDIVSDGWSKLTEFTADLGQRLANVESDVPMGQVRFYRIRLVE